MNAIFAALLRRLACAFTRPAYQSLQGALRHPRRAQERLLAQLLEAHETTEYGRKYGLVRTLSLGEFVNRVPIVDFDQGGLTPWVERQQSEPWRSILCPGGAQVFEKTSGSSGRSKLIPYNKSLLRSFEFYFRVWVYDLLAHGPRFETFHTFLSVSPAVRTKDEAAKAQEISQKKNNKKTNEKTDRKLKSPSPASSATIGLADDTEYLSLAFRLLLRPFLSVPLSLKTVDDPQGFLDLAAAYLASDSRLEIVSVWHPSFFEILWDHLGDNRQRIAGLLAEGKKLPQNQTVACYLNSEAKLCPEILWPKLKLLSAWSAGYSAGPARRLQDRFSKPLFQGKGLLATEAPMTIPLLGQGMVPFLTDVLFEFHDEHGKFFWVDGLNVGQIYSLVISQRGGLLRYAIGDQVLVTGKLASGAPFLEFMGRNSDCCDLVGEKMHAAFLSAQQGAFTARFGNAICCFMPRVSHDFAPHYQLLFDDSVPNQTDAPNHIEVQGTPRDADIAQWWEEKLQESFHYQYARSLGQLGPLKATRVHNLSRRMLELFQQRRNMKAGDVKAGILVKHLADADLLMEML